MTNSFVTKNQTYFLLNYDLSMMLSLMNAGNTHRIPYSYSLMSLSYRCYHPCHYSLISDTADWPAIAIQVCAAPSIMGQNTNFES